MDKIIGNLVGTTMPRIKVDEVLDANSNNAVSNKAVVEGIKEELNKVKAETKAYIEEVILGGAW